MSNGIYYSIPSNKPQKRGITVPTLRYYDRDELLPFVDKKLSGIISACINSCNV